MTTADPIRPTRSVRVHGVESLGFAAWIASAEMAAMFGLGALVSLGDSARTVGWFAGLAVITAGGAIAGFRRFPLPQLRVAPRVLAMVTLHWSMLIAGGAVAHVVAGATSSVTTALFEGTAGITTTAMTTLDAATLPRGLQLYRGLSQWFGGFGAVVLGIVVFPLVLGTKESSARLAVRGGRRSLLAGRVGGIERAMAVYGGLTLILVTALALAGVPAFDALVNGLTIGSTGGLTTSSASIGGFGAGAEWVASVGMLLAGVSVAALWWAALGDVGAVARSTELRAYLGAIALTFAVIAIDGGGLLGAFSLATSAVSTTGVVGSTTPADLGNGAATLVFFVGGIGAMAGSAGGGFGWMRLLQAIGFARRELVQQLHPDAVRVVKLGGRVIPEESLARTNGYVTMFTLTAGVGALAVALGDGHLGVATTISLSVSALSTSGLQAVAPVAISELSQSSLVALSVLMLLGHLAISAVLVTIATIGGRRSRRGGRLRRPREANR